MLDYAKIFEASSNAYVVIDRSLRIVALNAAYERATRSRREDLMGRNLFEAFPHDPDDVGNTNAALVRASFERVFATGEPDVIALVRYRVPKAPGERALEERIWSATQTPILDDDGRVAWVLQHTADVTHLREVRSLPPERRVHEQVASEILRRAEHVQSENRSLLDEMEVLRTLLDQAPSMVCATQGPEHRLVMANRAWVDFVGTRPLMGRTLEEAFGRRPVGACLEKLDAVFRTGEAYIGKDERVRVCRGGRIETRFVDLVYQPIRGADDRVWGILVQGIDTTERVRAERELARYRDHLEQLVEERTRELRASEAERRRAEAALARSQKMEALGNLTGGVAHDFNNLLQVISGNLQLLQLSLPAEERTQERLRIAAKAVDRGARLASQLLAYARRQPVDPTVLDPGAQLADLEDLIRRALGDGVVCTIEVADGTGSILADRSQLESMVLNLAINARDAMGGEGEVRIAARNVHLDAARAAAMDLPPGDYVELGVFDSGCGMTPDVLERATDPFFTTKPEGRGSGLGLSTVYGSMKQLGGHLELRSAPGRGTEALLYFPVTAAPARAAREAPRGGPRGGAERILVVEDDPAVRRTTIDLLEGLGYEVRAAEHGEAALEALRALDRVDLLFSDVLMPGPVRARELAHRARELHPGLRVLFTSGYAEDAILHGGMLDAEVHLLPKPFGRDELDRRIRALLDGRPARAASERRA